MMMTNLSYCNDDDENATHSDGYNDTDSTIDSEYTISYGDDDVGINDDREHFL